MGERPRVSVIVPVRDDPRLGACLDALEAQTYPAHLVDIVVADNGSRGDLRAALAGRPRVRLVAEPHGGSYTARNAAIAASTGAVLAFTDADCLPQPTWLDQAVAALAAGAGVVAGHVRVFARNAAAPHPVEAYELVHAFPQRTYASRGGACVTANMVTTRAAFEAVGPFQAALKSGADIEWSQRANAAGFRTVYCADAEVHHPARDSYAALRAKLRRVLQGRRDRDRLGSPESPAPWPRWRAFVPPLGAFRRAHAAPQLTTARARAAFVVGEFYHRYAAARIALGLAVRERTAQSRTPPAARADH